MNIRHSDDWWAVKRDAVGKRIHSSSSEFRVASSARQRSLTSCARRIINALAIKLNNARRRRPSRLFELASLISGTDGRLVYVRTRSSAEHDEPITGWAARSSCRHGRSCCALCAPSAGTIYPSTRCVSCPTTRCVAGAAHAVTCRRCRLCVVSPLKMSPTILSSPASSTSATGCWSATKWACMSWSVNTERRDVAPVGDAVAWKIYPHQNLKVNL